MKKSIMKLAEKISVAGKEIAMDNIAKDYLMEGTYKDTIIITSDGGYESITIGDVTSRTKGYMFLYTCNTERRNSFPNVKGIAVLLEKVMNKEVLSQGEGKAAYFKWDELPPFNKQLEYFSSIVKRMVSIEELIL